MVDRSVPFAVGICGLGILGVAFADFALQWQPVPPQVEGQTALAYLSAASLIAAGAMIVPPQTRRWGGFLAGGIFMVWVALHLRGIAAAPTDVSGWLGLAESLALAVAGLTVGARASREGEGETLRLPLRVVFGCCPIVFGLSHFVYAEFTASLVPDWLPAPTFWALATGGAHVAAGLAILSGVAARTAALGLSAMCGAFVLVLHLPRVVAAPGSHLEWTMLFMATSLAGAALVFSSSPTPPSRFAA